MSNTRPICHSVRAGNEQSHEKRTPGHKTYNSKPVDMLKNYFKIAWRNLWKNRFLSSINIFGLATGLACSLLIFLFVNDELSYDRYNKDADRVYRVVKDFVNDDGSRLPDATTPPAVAPAMQREIPGIEAVTRIMPNWGSTFLYTYKDKSFYEDKVARVDSSFFNVFTIKFVKGDAGSVFKQLNSIVISESAAKKYFGKEEPMGKVLHIDNSGDMMVTGVIQDMPANSHIHFDFISSIRKINSNIDGNWGWYNFYTYIKLKPGVKIKTINPKIEALYKKNDKEGKNIFYTQALTDIHLGSNLKWEIEPNSDKLYVYVFSAVALLIIIIAAINYINLVTARSSLRAKEVGIRKVSGAYNSALVKQFLIESVLICFIASVVALAIADLLLPAVNIVTQKQLSLFSSQNALITVYFILSALGIGVLAGFFPAVYLSSFKPITVLKGIRTKEGSIFTLRRALVVVQFSISIALIAGSVIIYQQVNYFKNAQLGLDKSQVLLINNFNRIDDIPAKAFASSMRRIPGVQKTATADGVIGGMNWTMNFTAKGAKNSLLMNYLYVGYDFVDVMGFTIKEGRGFSANFPADTISNQTVHTLNQVSGSVILNEKAVKDLGVPEPAAGQLVKWGNDGDTTYYLKIAGVVKDFHFASFKNEIKPFAFLASTGNQNYLTVKLSTQNLSATIAQIQSNWKQFANGRPLQYSFLDETFERLYKSETSFQQIFIVLVALSIIIACLGLFGLAAFATEQRTKEIGIRKVLGASVTGITAMLSKDFLKLVIISIVIATPLAWWAMNAWLQNYVYRVTISWWVFAIAGVLSMLIAFVTVSYQAIKAALANPVKSLRSE